MKSDKLADITIAFDIDGTLVSEYDRQYGYECPINSNIDLLKLFVSLGFDVYIWSLAGIDWCNEVVIRFSIEGVKVVEKGSFIPTVTFDDCDTENYGLINIKVKRG